MGEKCQVDRGVYSAVTDDDGEDDVLIVWNGSSNGKVESDDKEFQVKPGVSFNCVDKDLLPHPYPSKVPRAIVLLYCINEILQSESPSSVLGTITNELIDHPDFNQVYDSSKGLQVTLQLAQFKDFFTQLDFFYKAVLNKEELKTEFSVETDGSYQLKFFCDDLENVDTYRIELKICGATYSQWLDDINPDVPDDELSALEQQTNQHAVNQDVQGIYLDKITGDTIKDNQLCIGNALFERCKGFYSDVEWSRFDTVTPVIFVPNFKSLQKQTAFRCNAIKDVLVEEEKNNVNSLVVLTNTAKDLTELLNGFKKRVLDNPNELVIAVVDECHYGPTLSKYSVHFLINDQELCHSPNFVVLMVSATPHNVLTKTSRIEEKNIICWDHVLHESSIRPHYVGLNFYLSSLAFFLPSDQSISIVAHRINEAPPTVFRVSIPHYRLFTAKSILATFLNGVIRDTTRDCVGLVYRDDCCKFEFQNNNTRKYHKFDVCSTGGLLESLGFCKEFEFTTAIRGDGDITVDATRPLLSQRIRADQHFEVLLKKLESRCSYLKRGKITSPAATPVSRRTTLFEGEEVTSSNCTNSYVIIVEYMLSMAYYGSTRIDRHAEIGERQCLTPLGISTDGINFSECRQRFMDMLKESSCCKKANGKLFDVSDLVNNAMRIILDTVKKELKADAGNDYADCSDDNCLWEIYLKKKLEEEGRDGPPDTLSWFTESDRNVKMLLFDRHLPGNRMPAPIVALRVLDNDYSHVMETMLRHCMRVCELSWRDGAVTAPGFSILSDTSITPSILRSLGPYYGDRYNAYYCPDSSERKSETVGDRLVVEGGDPGKKRDARYEDLMNVPCLIILCAKGRMGDTFPHSLRVMDLRIRSAGTVTCLIQELGRVCRYPASHDIGIFDVSDPDSILTQCEPFMTTSNNTSAEKCGVLLFNEDHFIGVAEDTHALKRTIRMCQESNERITRLHLKRIDQPLPTILLSQSTAVRLVDSVKAQEERVDKVYRNGDLTGMELWCRDKVGAQQFVTGAAGYDNYIGGKGFKLFEGKIRKQQSGAQHYDLENTTKHPYRMCLWADPQNGKTLAYLHFIRLLRQTRDRRCQPLPSPVVAPSAAVCSGIPWITFQIPYWHSLSVQPKLDYGYPKIGKYHIKMALQRLDRYLYSVQTASDGDCDWVDVLVARLCRDEVVTAAAGGQRLGELKSKLDDLKSKSVDQSLNALTEDAIHLVMDWDGRMTHRWDQLQATKESWRDSKCLIEKYGPRALRSVQVMNWGSDEATGENIRDGEDEDEDEDDGHTESTDCHAGSDDQVCIASVRSQTNDSNLACTRIFGLSFRRRQHVTVSHNTELAGSHRICIGYSAKISFPSSVLKHTDSEVRSLEDFKNAIESPQGIKKWIFTPSFFGGRDCGPEMKLLDRSAMFSRHNDDGLVRWKDFIEVLVVRKTQHDQYEALLGGTHIIMTLPECLERRGDDGGVSTYKVDEGGIGYARLYIQLIAQALKLPAVWMVDDNVQTCWETRCNGETVTKDNVSLNRCSFADVMMQIEGLFWPPPESQQYTQDDCRHFERPFDGSDGFCKSLLDVTGPWKCYGVVGINRGSTTRQKSIKYPISRTHSIYSFFLMNVEDTVAKGLFYPAKPVWEDVEFLNLLDENGMNCCKIRKFTHLKQQRHEYGFPAWIANTYKYSVNDVRVVYPYSEREEEDRENVDVMKQQVANRGSSCSDGGNSISIIFINPPKSALRSPCRLDLRYTVSEIFLNVWRYHMHEIGSKKCLVLIIPSREHIPYDNTALQHFRLKKEFGGEWLVYEMIVDEDTHKEEDSTSEQDESAVSSGEDDAGDDDIGIGGLNISQHTVDVLSVLTSPLLDPSGDPSSPSRLSVDPGEDRTPVLGGGRDVSAQLLEKPAPRENNKRRSEDYLPAGKGSKKARTANTSVEHEDSARKRVVPDGGVESESSDDDESDDESDETYSEKDVHKDNLKKTWCGKMKGKVRKKPETPQTALNGKGAPLRNHTDSPSAIYADDKDVARSDSGTKSTASASHSALAPCDDGDGGGVKKRRRRKENATTKTSVFHLALDSISAPAPPSPHVNSYRKLAPDAPLFSSSSSGTPLRPCGGGVNTPRLNGPSILRGGNATGISSAPSHHISLFSTSSRAIAKRPSKAKLLFQNVLEPKIRTTVEPNMERNRSIGNSTSAVSTPPTYDVVDLTTEDSEQEP
jgi:hypothetical protein